jgi:hypothetical protein
MASTPIRKTATKKTILPDPGRVFYRPAVDDVLKRGELADIKALIKGAQAVKAKYGDIDGLISKLQAAALKAK